MNSEDQLRLENAIKDKLIIRKEVLKLKSKKNLDDLFRAEHDFAFKKRDCLACANCCKTTSPIFRDTDVKRIAKHLRVKESQFIASYLKMDDENDLVLKTAPCTFLSDDNTCSIYEYRPLACREYPHTNRKNMYQILALTAVNTQICPAVAQIVEKLCPIK
jgi:Fe-S-cluster containining protein